MRRGSLTAWVRGAVTLDARWPNSCRSARLRTGTDRRCEADNQDRDTGGRVCSKWCSSEACIGGDLAGFDVVLEAACSRVRSFQRAAIPSSAAVYDPTLASSGRLGEARQMATRASATQAQTPPRRARPMPAHRCSLPSALVAGIRHYVGDVSSANGPSCGGHVPPFRVGAVVGRRSGRTSVPISSGQPRGPPRQR